MKKKAILSILVLLLLTACANAGNSESAETSASLTVGEKTYSSADLESMTQAEAEFQGVTYIGIPVAELLAEAGYTLGDLKAVKAVAVDGFSANYEPAQLAGDGIIVAYAQSDGPLSSDDGSFRMVLPGEEGKLNVRMLAEIQVIQ